jgi:tetratricopeptide (TPR) repeat protein
MEWAFWMMPESMPARRMWIEQLIRQHDYESADALIARGLLVRPTDAALTLLRARSLVAQGRDEEAARELNLVLARRPHHAGALELAGRAALRLGRALDAAGFLERAGRRRPGEERRCLLAEAWLDAGRPRLARRVVRSMIAPPPLLVARLLRAEGRLLEAVETLEQAARHGDAGEAIVVALIDLIEETGDAARLRALLGTVAPDRPGALARCASSWLATGAFRTAALRMARLARVPGHRAAGLVRLMVAAAMMGRLGLARRALGRLRRLDEPVDRLAVAEVWARGLLGRLLADQCSPAAVADDGGGRGRLRGLLRGAAVVFAEDLARGGNRLPVAERRELRRCLAACRQGSA